MKKKLQILFISIVAFYSCSFNVDDQKRNHKDEVIKNGAYLFTENKIYDFGKVYKSKDKKVIIDIVASNTGDSPLILYKSDVSCGCLKVLLPKEPIPQNEKAIIKVTVDISSQKGLFNKAFFVKSNAKNNLKRIVIKGNIL